MRQVFQKLNGYRPAIDSFLPGCALVASNSQLRFRAVQCALGALLLAAAGVKVLQSLSGDMANASSLLPASLGPAVIVGELTLGLWLLSGHFTSAAWAIAVCSFIGFACYSTFALYQGHQSCGCFGAVKFLPGIALAIDFVAIGLLLTNRPPSVARFRALKIAFAGGFIVFAGGLILFATGFHRPADAGQAITVLRAEQWVGKPFPLLDQIDIGGELSDGDWIVLLYHHDCPKCIEAATRFAASKNDVDAAIGSAKVAFVELPPFGSFDSSNLFRPIQFGQLKLLEGSDIETPAAFQLIDGVIVDVVHLQ